MITLTWIQENFLNVVQILTLLVVAGELITRLTPTKRDDGFVRRIGMGMDRLLNMLRVPNLRRQVRQASSLDTPDTFRPPIGGPPDDRQGD